LAFTAAVAFRRSVCNVLLAAIVLLASIVTVGLTASTASPFFITLRPAFARLGIDLDVKIGTLHLHAGWSLLPGS
jgi:hypothetical protein